MGDLKIPARISQAQVSLRRDLGMVREVRREGWMKRVVVRRAAMEARRESFFALAERDFRAAGVDVWGRKIDV